MKAVNLVPSEQRRARPTGSLSGGAYAVVGVLAVLLAMAVAYVLTTNSLNSSQTEAEEARQQADAYEQRAAQLGSFTNFASIKDQRLASVMATAQTRFDWERLMRELALVMPEGSWLQTANASVRGDAAAEATATDPAAVAAAASPSAQLVGCTPKQDEVATMMLRLEQMHRVSEVSLNESAREQGAAEVTLDSCGSYYKFDLTVTFEPVPPAEAPVGSATVPAKLGGGS